MLFCICVVVANHMSMDNEDRLIWMLRDTVGNSMKNIIIIWFLIGLMSFLSACSGSSSEDNPFVNDGNSQDDTDGDATNDDSLIDEGDLTNVSYLPLMTIERHKDWYNGVDQDVFLYYFKSPFIFHFMINPIDASTGEAISTASAEDFTILNDGIPTNPRVNFPLLQKVVGNTVQLRSAIVVNTSTSMDVTKQNATEFINEIKAYIDAVKNSSISYIANQEFTIWAFDGVISEVTAGATSNEDDLKAALDSLRDDWLAGVYAGGGANYSYDAVVQAIGRYVGEGAFSTGSTLVFRDSVTAEADDNDLIDYLSPDLSSASSLLLFSAGYGNTENFDEVFVTQAIESQSTLRYEEGVELAGQTTETIPYTKTLIYVVPDGEPSDDVFRGLASTTIENSFSGTGYSFAEDVLEAQESDLEEKLSLNNQHVLRWTSVFRSGDGHSIDVKTRTADDKFGYILTINPIDFGVGFSDDPPQPQVEITGANNEYLASGTDQLDSYDAAITYADEISRFYPATRWTNQEFENSDYTWTFSGSDFTANDDGSVTLNTTDFPVTLILTNSGIEHQGATISDSFTLTIYASK